MISPPHKAFTTAIWYEEPDRENPYLARRHAIVGHDLREAARHGSWLEVWFLLFAGRAPTADEARLVEHLMIALIGPGPRHPASRATMVAAASMTLPVNLLPIGAALLGGEHMGGCEVRECARFLRQHADTSPEATAEQLRSSLPPPTKDGSDRTIAPGFGTRFGSVDPWAGALLADLCERPGAGAHLAWTARFGAAVTRDGIGPRVTAVAAACLTDMGFSPWRAAAIYQLMRVPGVLAHGLEYLDRRTDALPFVSDEEYSIDD